MWTPGAKCVLILLLLVVLLFFVQAPNGGFQATHGPHTTLKEGAAQRYMQSLIVFVAHICAALLGFSLSQGQEVSQSSPLFLSPVLANCTAPLLC